MDSQAVRTTERTLNRAPSSFSHRFCWFSIVSVSSRNTAFWSCDFNLFTSSSKCSIRCFVRSRFARCARRSVSRFRRRRLLELSLGVRSLDGGQTLSSTIVGTIKTAGHSTIIRFQPPRQCSVTISVQGATLIIGKAEETGARRIDPNLFPTCPWCPGKWGQPRSCRGRSVETKGFLWVVISVL